MEAEQSVVAEAPRQQPRMWGPIAGIFGGLAIFMFSQGITGLVLGLLAKGYGIEPTEVYDEYPLIVSFVGGLMLAVLSVGFVYLATKKYGSWKALRLAKPKLKPLVWVGPGIIGYIAFSAVLYGLVTIFFPDIDLNQDQEIGFESASSILQLGAAFFALVILAPISEEILFRGYTFQGIRRNFHWVLAAIVSSAMFGMAHLQINVAIDTFAMGMAACWLLEKTGSLWPAILLHGIKNSIAFYFLFVAG